MASIWIIHGPNLNLLGQREPNLYGTTTLEEINRRLAALAQAQGHCLVCYQSNHEGDLVTWIQEAAREQIDLLLINPGAYTHTSVAIRDALLGARLLTIEVHLSSPEAREPFRHVSYLADVVQGRVTGFGPSSYEIALYGGLLRLAQSDGARRKPDDRRAAGE